MVYVNVHKLYKGIEQLYYYLEIPKTELHWFNGLSPKEPGFKLLAKLYPTYKTKQTKTQKFYMGYSIYTHTHLHLVGCKTNGERRMVLINLQNTFDIINHKTLLKKNELCWIFSNSIAWFLGLNCTSVYQFSSEYQK